MDPNVNIGSKPLHNYVLAVVSSLNANRTATIRARGYHITKAVDVAEIVKDKFAKAIATATIGTDTLNNVRVSSIEIKLVRA